MHSTKSEACPNSTTIFEEHPLSALFSLPRRVKTQKQEKFRKRQLLSEIPWCEHENQPVHLLINKRKIERRRNLRIL